MDIIISITTFFILIILTILWLILLKYRPNRAFECISCIFNFFGKIVFFALSALFIILFVVFSNSVSNREWGIISIPIAFIFFWRVLSKLHENTIGQRTEELDVNDKNYFITCNVIALSSYSLLLAFQDNMQYIIITYTSIAFWMGAYIPISELLSPKNAKEIVSSVLSQVIPKNGNPVKKGVFMFFYLILSFAIFCIPLLFQNTSIYENLSDIFNSIGIGIGYYGLFIIVLCLVLAIISIRRGK